MQSKKKSKAIVQSSKQKARDKSKEEEKHQGDVEMRDESKSGKNVKVPPNLQNPKKDKCKHLTKSRLWLLV